MVDSTFVFESGDPIDVGSAGENDFVLAGGEQVTDGGVSKTVFEAGTGLGTDAGGFPITFEEDSLESAWFGNRSQFSHVSGVSGTPQGTQVLGGSPGYLTRDDLSIGQGDTFRINSKTQTQTGEERDHRVYWCLQDEGVGAQSNSGYAVTYNIGESDSVFIQKQSNGSTSKIASTSNGGYTGWTEWEVSHGTDGAISVDIWKGTISGSPDFSVSTTDTTFSSGTAIGFRIIDDIGQTSYLDNWRKNP